MAILTIMHGPHAIVPSSSRCGRLRQSKRIVPSGRCIRIGFTPSVSQKMRCEHGRSRRRGRDDCMIHVMCTDLAAARNQDMVLGRPLLGRLTKMIGIFLIVLSLGGCRHPAQEPVTLTFLDPEWSHDLTERNVLPDERLQEFMRQTGIRVKHLPVSATALDQLGEALEVLRKGSSSPDVSGVDVIWPGTLSEDLIDLKPYFVKELSSVDPDVVASYKVNGKLVAVPYVADIGVLFYRKDLLREYGYGTPPRTWDQLEKMAARIQ